MSECVCECVSDVHPQATTHVDNIHKICMYCSYYALLFNALNEFHITFSGWQEAISLFSCLPMVPLLLLLCYVSVLSISSLDALLCSLAGLQVHYSSIMFYGRCACVCAHSHSLTHEDPRRLTKTHADSLTKIHSRRLTNRLTKALSLTKRVTLKSHARSATHEEESLTKTHPITHTRAHSLTHEVSHHSQESRTKSHSRRRVTHENSFIHSHTHTLAHSLSRFSISSSFTFSLCRKRTEAARGERKRDAGRDVEHAACNTRLPA